MVVYGREHETINIQSAAHANDIINDIITYLIVARCHLPFIYIYIYHQTFVGLVKNA